MKNLALTSAVLVLMLALLAGPSQADLRVQSRYGQPATIVHGGSVQHVWYPGFQAREAPPLSDLPAPPPPYGTVFHVPGYGYREYSGDFYWDLRGLHGNLPAPVVRPGRFEDARPSSSHGSYRPSAVLGPDHGGSGRGSSGSPVRRPDDRPSQGRPRHGWDN